MWEKSVEISIGLNLLKSYQFLMILEALERCQDVEKEYSRGLPVFGAKRAGWQWTVGDITREMLETYPVYGGKWVGLGVWVSKIRSNPLHSVPTPLQARGGFARALRALPAPLP
jgi:hypothetical protein